VIYDSDLGPGVIRWERGIDGHSVRVERTVKDADGAGPSTTRPAPVTILVSRRTERRPLK
jgi:hypothetical protein